MFAYIKRKFANWRSKREIQSIMKEYGGAWGVAKLDQNGNFISDPDSGYGTIAKGECLDFTGKTYKGEKI